jgi:hypothetical protein
MFRTTGAMLLFLILLLAPARLAEVEAPSGALTFQGHRVEEATNQGLIKGSESARLQFVAAAEHALVTGAQNPCGLFVHLIRRRLWHFIAQDDYIRIFYKLL